MTNPFGSDQAAWRFFIFSRDGTSSVETPSTTGLPATVLGLLFHAAEHTTRHVGQAVTTQKILANGGAGRS